MRNFSLSLACVLLAACAGKPPELYSLTVPPPSVAPCRAKAGIVIHEPVTAPGLDSARIVVVDKPQHQTFYKDVRWNAPTSLLVQHYLAESFEQSGMFAPVLTDDTGAQVPLALETQLRAFEIDQSAGVPQVVIRLTVTLIRNENGKTLKSMPLETVADASGRRIDGIAALFSQQLGFLSEQMLRELRPAVPGCR